MSIVTISRQLCSLGNEISIALSNKTGLPRITRDELLHRYLRPITNDYEFDMLQKGARAFLHTNDQTDGKTFIEYAKDRLTEDGHKDGLILVGFGSHILFRDDPEAFHVRIFSPLPTRIHRIKNEYHLSDEDAQKTLLTADKKQKKFITTVFDKNPDDPSMYDISLNTTSLSVDVCASLLFETFQQWQLREKIERQNKTDGTIDHRTERPIFHNEAEKEFARILDMYQIEWQYEPRTFPIKWDEDGNVTMAFSPDFYLTQFDTYLELTTMSQKYVTEKNKKARMVRELYPGTNVKIVYKKDFQSLIERFGGSAGL